MKRIFALLLAVIICLSFTSCKDYFLPIDKLMRPPELSGGDKKLQEAFENSVSEYDNIVFKIPISGKYKSSYILFDFDSDGVEEAIILYSVPTMNNTNIVEILKYTDNKWTSISRISNGSYDIYEVDFADINGNGYNELLLGWTEITQNNDYTNVDLSLNLSHTLTIYSYNEEKTDFVGTETYSNLFINDLNSDKAYEILLFNNSFSSNANLTSARILSYNKDYSVKYDNTTNITGVLEIESITSDRTVINGQNISRVFVDGAVSDTELITEIIQIDEKSFEVSLPLYYDNLSDNPSTLRNSNIYCLDVENDGYIEIPTLEEFPYSYKYYKDNTTPLELVIWSEHINNTLRVKFKTLVNAKLGHIAFIPEDFIGTVAVTYDEDNRNLSFYAVKSDGTISNALFSYRIFTLPEWEENTFNYEKIHENDTYVYAFLIFKADNYDSYKKYITENFYAL